MSTEYVSEQALESPHFAYKLYESWGIKATLLKALFYVIIQ